MPDKTNTTEILMGYRATMGGTADLLDKAMYGQQAILKLLQDESIPLNDFHRGGLLAALAILGDSVARRGYQLKDCLDEHAEQLGCSLCDPD